MGLVDVFVSYARRDYARVAPLVAALQAEGWSVWWDPEISPGEEFDALIADALENALSVVVVWTPNSVDSRWVRGEARDASDRGVLVPVRFGNAKLPIDFRAVHTIDLDDWNEDTESESFQRIRRVLASKLGSSPESARTRPAARPPRSRDAPAGTALKRRAVLLLVAMLALGIGVMLAKTYGPQPGYLPARMPADGAVTPAAGVAIAADQSIAVLPFVNRSSDAEQEYFSDGISEELLNLLAKIPELRVISRSSAFSFKGKDIAIPEIARQLNVAHILEGSVRRSGSTLRITAQLIDARSDTQLWSETWDRPLDDIFTIQDEIAATVVEQLKLTLLGGIPHAQETSAEAYALYLQARYLGRQVTAESFAQSNALYQQALAIDPGYAAAWDGLARNYARQVGNGLLSFEEGSTLAHEAAEKALALDPDSARAHALLGWITMLFDKDLAQAARHIERALQLAPADLFIIRNAAMLLHALGRLDEAIVLEEHAIAQDPVDPIGHANLGTNYLLAGRNDDAIAAFETALRLSPGYIGAYYWIGTALLFEGKAEEALVAFARESDEEYRVKGAALASHALGREEEYQARLDELIERWGDQWPSEVAHVYAWTRETDRAFEWLARSAAEEDGAFDPKHPMLWPLKSDPRWLLLLESIGKSPAQLQLDAIEFEVRLLQSTAR
jgi:TolB-like protein/Tfp pilus assembly protein PilF